MVKIINSQVNYYPDFNFYKIIIYARLDEQNTNDLKEFGNGKEDEYTLEYELKNKTLLVLWK